MITHLIYTYQHPIAYLTPVLSERPVERGDDAGDAPAADLVSVDVHADDHESGDGYVAAPKLTTELAVHLEQDFAWNV